MIFALVPLVLVVAAVPSRGDDPDKAQKSGPSQDELERKFVEDLTGATLVGHFSVDGRDAAPGEERYKISKVTKVEGETWLFEAQIVYGKHDVTLPLPLTVKWAGDTPVITLTDMLVPGLGTYTARVLIYRGQYAGTWSGADHGGEMWGRLEKPGKEGGETKPAEADKALDKKSGRKS
jgi:hypothetical protein